MPKWGDYRDTLERFAREGLLPAGKPDSRYYNDNRVDRQRAKPPRVGGRHDVRSEDDRADNRDQEDEPDREDDGEEV